MTAVTPVPSSTPRIGLPVSRNRIGSSLLPDSFFKPSPISDIPNKNSAMPLSIDIISEIPIVSLLIHPVLRFNHSYTFLS